MREEKHFLTLLDGDINSGNVKSIPSSVFDRIASIRQKASALNKEKVIMSKYKIKKGSIEVKRLYLPIEVVKKCPKCGLGVEDDFESNYLSYPNINVEWDRHLYCDSCDTEFSYKVTLQVTLVVGEDTTIY